MKKVIIGVIVGFLISIMGNVYANTESFTALKASFKIFVNGEELKSDKSPVVIDGSTYLPLKVIGDNLGVKVAWNNELRQVEIGEPTSVSNDVYTFNNPVDIGETTVYMQKDKDDIKKFEITLKEILRGESAELFYKDNYQFYDFSNPEDLEKGFEYMLVKFNFKPMLLKENTYYYVSEYQFELISQGNQKYLSPNISGLKEKLGFGGQLYQGDISEGWIAYKVRKDDLKPRISFDSSYNKTGIWFKAYQD